MTNAIKEVANRVLAVKAPTSLCLERLRERRQGDLEESALSTVLFHLTDTVAAVNILKADRFELKPAEGTTVEEGIKLAYYLSCARSRTSDYFYRGICGSSVILTLDGSKLNARYAGHAVEYWGREMRNLGNNEMEDRVFSRTPFIPKASGYIKSIDCAVSETAPHRSVFELYRRAKLKNIPIRFFIKPEKGEYKTFTKRFALGLNPELNYKPGRPEVQPPSEYQLHRDALTNHKSGFLWRWAALYKLPETWDADKLYAAIKDDKGLCRVHTQLYYSDGVNQLTTEMHNAKSDRYGQPNKERETLDYLVGVMRRNKWTPKDFYNHLVKKFTTKG